MKRLSALICTLALAGCAAYDGRGLRPGESRVADVIARMGPPRTEWNQSDGGRVLAYPRGPMGLHTYLASIAADGRLLGIENVLDADHLHRVKAGMTQDEVLRLIGPPEPNWTIYFPARNELVWEWAYCDEWSQRARFDVLFDGHDGPVRSTLSIREETLGECPPGVGCWCGH